MEKKYAYNSDFNETFRRNNAEQFILSTKLRKVCRKYTSRNYYRRCVKESFPFIDTLRSYKLKENIANDIISGLTVGVMQIPQGNLTCQIDRENSRRTLWLDYKLRCAVFAKKR